MQYVQTASDFTRLLLRICGHRCPTERLTANADHVIQPLDFKMAVCLGTVHFVSN